MLQRTTLNHNTRKPFFFSFLVKIPSCVIQMPNQSTASRRHKSKYERRCLLLLHYHLLPFLEFFLRLLSPPDSDAPMQNPANSALELPELNSAEFLSPETPQLSMHDPWDDEQHDDGGVAEPNGSISLWNISSKRSCSSSKVSFPFPCQHYNFISNTSLPLSYRSLLPYYDR